MQTMNPNSYNCYPNYMACQSSGGNNTCGMNQTGVFNNQNIVQAFHQVNTVQHVQMQGGQLQIMQQQYQYVQGQNMNMMQQGQGVNVNSAQRPNSMPAGGMFQGQGTNAMHGQIMHGQNTCVNNANTMQGQGMNMVTGQPGMNSMQSHNMNVVQGQGMNSAQQQCGNVNVMGGQYQPGYGYGVVGQGNLVMGGHNTGHCGSMVGLQNHHSQQQQQHQQQQQQMVPGNMAPDQQQQQPLMMGGAMQGNMTMVPVGAKMDASNMSHVNMMGIPGGTVGVANPMCGNMPVGAPTVPAAADNKNFIPLVVPFGWRRVVNGGQVVYIR